MRAGGKNINRKKAPRAPKLKRKGMNAMPREYLTDEQVEAEIARLIDSENVRLARREQRIKYKRRQVLYNLRALEKRGAELAAAGITLEMLDDCENEEACNVL